MNQVICDRGDCTFAEKVRNAEDAGAVAVVIVNYEDSANLRMVGGKVGGKGERDICIPAVFVSSSFGSYLKTLVRASFAATLTPTPTPPPSSLSSLSSNAQLFVAAPPPPRTSLSALSTHPTATAAGSFGVFRTAFVTFRFVAFVDLFSFSSAMRSRVSFLLTFIASSSLQYCRASRSTNMSVS
jgi:hypothetical protein